MRFSEGFKSIFRFVMGFMYKISNLFPQCDDSGKEVRKRTSGSYLEVLCLCEELVGVTHRISLGKSHDLS